ncbi:MAG: septal ring lytic transglycosylase RlpA family protein [Bacteroidota bacterium]|nr:septal ring lytic transglycosylase RlpA family protein [Bacteroidota bacterium]
MVVRLLYRWSLLGWLVFWGVLVLVLSLTLLVQARESGVEDSVEDLPDSTAERFVVQEWGPFAVQEGLATWYGPGFHGRRTASGERYNMYELTAAHRWLPFGVLVRVSLPNKDSAVVVQITDRGPFVRRRIIDLSWAAARALGVRLHPVRIEAFLPPQDRQSIVGFGLGWRPYVFSREAFTILDTITEWTEAVRMWQRYRAERPEAWLLVAWPPGQDSAESRQPYRLWFHVGILLPTVASSLWSSRVEKE